MTTRTYNIIIDRLSAFASGHYWRPRFTHGQIDEIDISKDNVYPLMHAVPTGVSLDTGTSTYAFDIFFADLPRDKQDAREYQREAISDMMLIAMDLVNEITNGKVLFGSDVDVNRPTSITPFIREFSNTLSGVTLSVEIVVPYNWNACDIPASYAVGGSGSGGSGGSATGIILKVNGVLAPNQTVLNLVQDDNITITAAEDGSVTFDVTGGGGGGITCDDLAECATIVAIIAAVQGLGVEVDQAKEDIAAIQIALANKVDKNADIVGKTATKITYDSKGLVTGSTDATTADIAESSNRSYVTDAQQTVIGNTSGTNTGDETASTIKTKLGTTTLGEAVNTLPNPSAVTFFRINANNTVTARTAAELKSDLNIIDTVTLSGGVQGGVVPASTTHYFVPTVDAAGSTVEGNRNGVVSFAGTLKNIYFLTLGAQPASGAMVVTIRHAVGMGAFADTAITFTIAAGTAAGIFSDITHSHSVAAGDRLSLRCANAATGNSASIGNWQILIERTQ